MTVSGRQLTPARHTLNAMLNRLSNTMCYSYGDIPSRGWHQHPSGRRLGRWTGRGQRLARSGAGGAGGLGQRLHEPFEGLVKSPIERRSCDLRHLKLQIRPQHICLVCSPQRPRRDYHGPHQHFEVPFALSLNHAELLAEAVDFWMEQSGIEDLPHLVTRHGFSRLRSFMSSASNAASEGEWSMRQFQSQVRRSGITGNRGLNGDDWSLPATRCLI